MITSRKLLLLVMAAVVGCQTATASGPRTDSRILTQDEIAKSALTGNAYDVIQRLRPAFMRSRGETSITNATVTSAFPNVYLDGVMYGDINSLRGIDSSQIAEVRSYQAWEAQTKFGTGNNGGVIAITTRR